MKLVVIDYDSGNLRSVTRAIESQGVVPLVTGNPKHFAGAAALILPGVGSGPAAMAALENRRLVPPIKEFIDSGKPFLGICLGLQLLMERTEEGDSHCLGVVKGQTKLLPSGQKIPHMGWNSVRFKIQHPLLNGIPQDSYFYFVHSYYANPENPNAIAGTTEYGIPFCSIYSEGNLVATQFHPEKSGSLGLRLYKNFIDLAS